MVAQANATEVSTPNDTDIVMTRVFDAPAALVWEASTKPEHIERWWGPRAYTVEVKEMDVRAGGTYRIHHRNAEGQTFMFSGTYLELEQNSRMVLTQVFDGIEGAPASEQPGDQMLVTNTLEEHGGKTTLTSTCHLSSKAARDQVLGYGMTDGAAESYDRLSELLQEMAAGIAAREIVISRLFDAPRDLVFEVWLSAGHLANWFGPDGWSITTETIDIRTGGHWQYVMHGPNGEHFPNYSEFYEVTPPERLVYRHGGQAEETEVDFHVTVTFEDQDGKTFLTMKSLFPTADARDLVVREFGAIEGGKQTLAKLAAYLESL